MSILNNAIDSIAVGLEDYSLSASDPRRIVSCTRNIFAGVLLLFKHKLSLLSDLDSDEALVNYHPRRGWLESAPRRCAVTYLLK